MHIVRRLGVGMYEYVQNGHGPRQLLAVVKAVHLSTLVVTEQQQRQSDIWNTRADVRPAER